MDEFLRDLALLLIGAVFGPFFWRLIRIPGLVKTARRKVERRTIDHDTWVERNYAALLEDLRRVDEEMSARGILQSSIRNNERERVRREHLWRLEDEQRAWLREVEDAFDSFGVPERLYTRWMLRKPLDPIPEKVIMSERAKVKGADDDRA